MNHSLFSENTKLADMVLTDGRLLGVLSNFGIGIGIGIGIGSGFMSECLSLASVDLSGFTNVASIGSNFMYFCLYLSSIQLGVVDLSNIAVPLEIHASNSPSNILYADSPAIAAAFKVKVRGLSNWSVVINP